MNDLTQPQLSVLQFFEQQADSNQPAPTIREICGEMGYSSTKAAHDVVAALEKKGWISRDGGKARSIRLLRRSNNMIPVLGGITAGLASEASLTEGETLALNPKLFGIPANHRAFALRVRGESMIGRRMFDGDLVICDADAEAKAGSVVVALIDQESTLKTMVQERGKNWLKAENPDYPEIFPVASLTVQGVAYGVIRPLVT
ncbi:transcriptional repressor LexA [Roseibacillus persicicus]|uniref:transcriptional repressor LexA n=1 Tax=Roseibacillus persicicus TaxID=454148 RepID=UPI00280CCA31|nr:transcriptional repressor LexA [Roseibacillus persicicus]MDQ8190250.1 transcriptional repressor LexA [Roseibacillus persicicus]